MNPKRKAAVLTKTAKRLTLRSPCGLNIIPLDMMRQIFHPFGKATLTQRMALSIWNSKISASTGEQMKSSNYTAKTLPSHNFRCLRGSLQMIIAQRIAESRSSFLITNRIASDDSTAPLTRLTLV